MAARWGAGEETLTACNMEIFPLDTLDETDGLSTEEALEALQSCLDPSILSMFEDAPTIETKGVDEESDATLLTALTEILDNVDDENLSPFDTLPDSDLLSGQKGREHSPLRRLLCLSRSPPEKDTLCSGRVISTGKSLPRMQMDSLQRSDGEEEDDGSLTSSPDSDLLDWQGPALPLPVSFDQEGEDGVSYSLGDLVRHMHPYCMSICLENDNGEEMLPEGGILLEVVDQSENGEPILAIPDINLPMSLLLKEQFSENEQKLEDSDSSEHIVVDDDDDDEDGVTVSHTPVTVTAPATPAGCSEVKNKVIVTRPENVVKEKSSSCRKKKKKCKEQCQSEPVEGRVLRSGTARKTTQEAPRKPEKRSVKGEKKRVPKVPPATSSVKLEKLKSCQTKAKIPITTQTLRPDVNVQVATHGSPGQDRAPLNKRPETSQSGCSPTAVCSRRPTESVIEPSPAPDRMEDSSAAPPAVLASQSTESASAAPLPPTPPVTPPVCERPPPVAPAAPEPKPKSLSLAEYRRLRQQKKPAPVEQRDDNSTKWPSLPELPKELPLIPCLPEPKDPRRPTPQVAKKEVEVVKPAWQPRGPAAPPTPEALLAPPAYMLASSSKASAATPAPKPRATPEPEKPLSAVSNQVKDLPTPRHTPAQTAVLCVPRCSGSPAPSGGKGGVSEGSQSQPVSLKSVELAKTCPKTTTDSINPIAATPSAPSVPQKTSVVFPKVPGITAATKLNHPTSAHGETSKPNSGAHPAASQSLKRVPLVLKTKENSAALLKPRKAKDPTQELIEAFTTEIGIEAADLTSLLEQFEETQAKEEKCVPEVYGRAAAVGNSSFELVPEKSVVERVRANDLSSTAALTPPATPPHQMWKPLAPVALLAKSKVPETPKSSPSKVIQIEARPLPVLKSRSKPTPTAPTVDPRIACIDHDYCLPNKGTFGDPGKHWNVKQPSFITIKPINKPTTTTSPIIPAARESSVSSTTSAAATTKMQDFPPTHGLDHSSLLETPDSSPARQEADSTVKVGSPGRGPFGRAYRRHAASRTPSPGSSPEERTGGRSRKRRSHRSPSPMSSGSESDSNSSSSRSGSRAPSEKRYRPRHSESSSSSSSRSSSRSSPSVSRSPPRRRRYSYSSSHSGSWSRSRSRSRSPQRRADWSRSRAWRSPSCTPGYGPSANANVEQVRRRKEKAIEERRVVYVGRIRGTMTQKELKERFSMFGEIEECTLHFRDQGDNYGFVTYYDTKDAFTAIENGSKLRQPNELPFDLCFGGRRQFCKSNYADLDSNREYDSMPVKAKLQALDFDTLLKQAQQNLKR